MPLPPYLIPMFLFSAFVTIGSLMHVIPQCLCNMCNEMYFHLSTRRAPRAVYVGTASHPASLLPGLEDDLLDPELDSDLLKGLVTASEKGLSIQLMCSDSDYLFPLPINPSFAEQVTLKRLLMTECQGLELRI